MFSYSQFTLFYKKSTNTLFFKCRRAEIVNHSQRNLREVVKSGEELLTHWDRIESDMFM